MSKNKENKKNTNEKKMKTNKVDRADNNPTTESWNRTAAKGALVWGTVYSTATSGAAYLIAPAMNGTVAMSDVVMESLIVFPAVGAARGLLMRRARNGKETGKRGLSSKAKSRRHARRVLSKAA